MVRSLDSAPGEWEVNSLFYQKGSRFSEMKWAPEIEFVVARGFALEFELPMEGDALKYYKFAAQGLLHQSKRMNTLHGLQLIYETDVDFLLDQWTLYYILAHRFNHHWSLVALAGTSYAKAVNRNFAADINVSLFYNYSTEVDFGIEINHQSKELGEAYLNIVPQLHLAFNKGYKLQYGFGVSYTEKETSAITTFRLIREFN